MYLHMYVEKRAHAMYMSNFFSHNYLLKVHKEKTFWREDMCAKMEN